QERPAIGAQHAATTHKQLRCVKSTPLGRPVVPDVYNIHAGSSSPKSSRADVGEEACTKSSKFTISTFRIEGWPLPVTTMVASEVTLAAISHAPFACSVSVTNICAPLFSNM